MISFEFIWPDEFHESNFMQFLHVLAQQLVTRPLVACWRVPAVSLVCELSVSMCEYAVNCNTERSWNLDNTVSSCLILARPGSWHGAEALMRCWRRTCHRRWPEIRFMVRQWDNVRHVKLMESDGRWLGMWMARGCGRWKPFQPVKHRTGLGGQGWRTQKVG